MSTTTPTAKHKPLTAEALNAALETAVKRTPFLAYSPVRTFSDPSNRILLDRLGRPIAGNPDNPDPAPADAETAAGLDLEAAEATRSMTTVGKRLPF